METKEVYYKFQQVWLFNKSTMGDGLRARYFEEPKFFDIFNF